VLILNTDLPAETFVFDNALQVRLSGVLIRENVGFDFAAWAHCWSLYKDKSGWSRLLLVNDSIVGPLGASEFDRMLARVRRSEADVVGLTENLAPARHLQSYFLVFNITALRSEVINNFFGRILNWPSKSQVIDVYETRMTGLLRTEGLCCEALFPALSDDPLSSNDISLRWAELIAVGFPYLKTMVISQDERARALLVSARVADSVGSDL
jgi:lipopolysaccharide biosynthesis protein